MIESVVIIGAPRSGTNMLRDMLIELPGVGTWSCDEINYIWRHGNLRYPSDEFTAEMATPAVQNYIRQQFDKLANVQNVDTIIEKTCANSLRVGFVDKVLPEAKYIFIVRDGMDVVGSALQRWTASLDVKYILQKVRYIPLADLLYYAFRYLYHRMYRLFSREKRLALWGPAMDDIDGLLKQYSLTEVCALQWKTCVDRAEEDFTKISADRIIRIRYEDFVSNPISEFSKLALFLGKEVPNSVNEFLKNNVRPDSVGKGRKALTESVVKKLQALVGDTLNRHSYD